MSGIARAREPSESFRDRSRHAPHWISPRRDRSHDEQRPHGMLGADVRPVCARATVDAVAANRAIRVGPERRRCEHRGGPDLPDTVLADIVSRKPIGDIREERLRAADNCYLRQPAAAGAFGFLEYATTDPDAKPDQSGAPDRTAAAACAAGNTAANPAADAASAATS